MTTRQAMTEIHTDDLKRAAPTLTAGEQILLSGTVYTSRDAAHKRIFAMLANGEPLPYSLSGAVIYYAGPTPAKDGMAIGSCGPTTSSRMDRYAPEMLDRGLAAMIGKGPRSGEVIDAIRRNKGLYLCAIGGAGALAAKHITACEVIAFEDLGCESVKKLTFDRFPLFVGIDTMGNTIFQV